MTGFDRRMLFIALPAVILGIAAGARLLAQTPASSGDRTTARDTMSELLDEVRSFRAELGETARTSLQSQFLMTRLQLQEQRLFHLDRQRSEIAAKRIEAERALSTMTGQMKALKDEIRQNNDQGLEHIASGITLQEKAQQSLVNQLREQEAELMNALAAEQTRWSDFNERLDNLERSLPAKR